MTYKARWEVASRVKTDAVLRTNGKFGMSRVDSSRADETDEVKVKEGD
jgi:hypothetical protein